MTRASVIPIAAGAIGCGILGYFVTPEAWAGFGGWPSIAFASGGALVGAVVAGMSTASYEIWKEDQAELDRRRKAAETEAKRILGHVLRSSMRYDGKSYSAESILLRFSQELVTGMHTERLAELPAAFLPTEEDYHTGGYWPDENEAFARRAAAEKLLRKLVILSVLRRKRAPDYTEREREDEETGESFVPSCEVGIYTLTEKGKRIVVKLAERHAGGAKANA